MDKAIYKIRGNVFFKLGIYILVAVLAYGTLYTGGLVLQGSYLGVYSDDDQGATPYERLVNDYVEDTNYALTEKVNAYIQDTRSQPESASCTGGVRVPRSVAMVMVLPSGVWMR